MQISDLTRQYTGTTASDAMTETRGVEKLVSTVRELTVGNIFEGTVNSISNGKVTLGLSNGSELSARLEANMKLSHGQSMFFQVKSNDGETIAIRPYTVDGEGVNLTLSNALKAANLPITAKNLNMVNAMMQEQMPINQNGLANMARILMANPDMSVNTLVQMKKLDIPITSEMASQFENYMDDTAAVNKAMDRFVSELPHMMEGKAMTLEQMKNFDSQLLNIIADGMDVDAPSIASQSINVTEGASVVGGETSVVSGEAQIIAADGNVINIDGNVVNADSSMVNADGNVVNADGNVVNADGNVVNADGNVVNIDGSVIDTNGNLVNGESQLQNATNAETVVTETVLDMVVADDGIIDVAILENPEETTEAVTVKQTQNITTQEKVLNLLNSLFGETGITREDNAASLLNKLSNFILNGNVSKETLSELFSNKDMQQFLREILDEQMYLAPKDVADKEKVQKLFERLERKTSALESLLTNTNLGETTLAHTVTDVHSNIEFMNQLNEAYTFVQIPLKMSGQNASGQLYVYTNKRDLGDPERDLTAFLHLDMDHLGSTDVSVRMHKREVDTKFYMDNDESFALIKAHSGELEERLRKKGFNCNIYVESEGKKVNFVDDFLKKDAPSTGQLHRYSFDVRA